MKNDRLTFMLFITFLTGTFIQAMVPYKVKTKGPGGIFEIDADLGSVLSNLFQNEDGILSSEDYSASDIAEWRNLMLTWKQHEAQGTATLIDKLLSQITMMENPNQRPSFAPSTGNFILLFINSLDYIKHESVSEVKKLLTERYFCIVKARQGEISALPIFMYVNVAAFFPCILNDEDGPHVIGSKSKILPISIRDSKVLKLLYKLMCTWYQFATSYKLTFEQSSSTETLNMVFKALMNNLVLTDPSFQEFFNDILEVAQELNLEPLKVSLISCLLNESDFIARLDPQFAENALRLSLSINTIESVLKVIERIKDEERYRRFIPAIKNKVADFIVLNIRKLIEDRKDLILSFAKQKAPFNGIEQELIRKFFNFICKFIKQEEYNYSPSPILSCTFEKGNNRIVISRYDGSVDAPIGVQVHHNNGSKIRIMRSFDTVSLITASSDNTIRLWQGALNPQTRDYEYAEKKSLSVAQKRLALF